MAVRRHAARLATVGALLGGLVLTGAAPAMADDDLVRVRAADSFTAGGSAEGVSVEVRKRTDGCVMLRTALGLRLAGLQANQVTVQVSYGGRWFPVPLGGGSGALSTTQTAPAKPTLCKGKGITVRYRVTFAATAPNGRLSVIGEAGTASGRDLGRDADSARVTGGRALVSPTPSTKPSPTPTPEPTEAPADADSTPAALAAPTGGPATTDEDSSGLSPVMFVGLALVAVGALLIVFLVRRSRQDKASAGEPVLPLPGNPGGTTYRAGGGVPAAPVQPGPVYGQPPATGGVYGVPSPRPSGGIYGARPDATRPLPGYPGGAAPAGPEPAPPAGQPGGATPSGYPGGATPAGPGSASPPAPGASANSPSPAGPPTPGPSSATSASTAGPSTPGPSSAPGQAGPPPAAGGGEHTVYMPRLPG